MKKTIIIAAALALSAGVLSSQVKVNAKPTAQPTITITKVTPTYSKDLGSAD
jgi:hypothetical protein